MELINICGDYIGSLWCKRYKTKKTKDLDEGVLKKNFNYTSRFWGYDEKFSLMIRKGVYPYEYMDGWKKFEETSLPLKHAQQVWNIMEKKALSCYHDIYLKKDILLLADVFEAFRNTCLKNYKLDPAHFYTAPRLGWQALLNNSRRVL